MLKLKIDNTEYRVPKGISVMGAARMHGIHVPSMCYRDGKPHFTSCMICLVKDRKSGKLFPSCSLKVAEGMDIISRDEEVEEARRMALELLLSEHVGDCEAPCTITCPAHMNIPLMNRLLASGDFAGALEVVRRDIALPAVFGYVCPAPCEGACHRKSVDNPVSICLLKRFAGENGRDKDDSVEAGPTANGEGAQSAGRTGSPQPGAAVSTGKKVLVVGSGAAGLAAAYYLGLSGHEVTVADRRNQPGGSLWDEVDAGKLPRKVLESETEHIAAVGVQFRTEYEVTIEGFEKAQQDYDAVLVASGNGNSGDRKSGCEAFAIDPKEIDNQTFRWKTSRVFVAGSALKTSKLAIRAHGQGKEAAMAINQFLSGQPVTGAPRLFNSRFGRLTEAEKDEYLKGSETGNRIEPTEPKNGLTAVQVMTEAARCMYCDCRKADNCLLRDLSDEYRAKQKHFWSAERKPVVRHYQHDEIVYEPAKCIKCGKCVEITREHGEKYGLSFIGRGFDVVVGVPFNENIREGLKEVGREVAEACPTGALAMK